MIIKIYEASDGGFFYDIYTAEIDDTSDVADSDDGGQCTSGDIADAIRMASEQAIQLIKSK